ncbi:sulfotransferase family protein [Marinococcus halotolerans]|uniref:sulfotransferase family protein n=1 Tax=Marinococcus halotolerans TaxID=301092 RepID=UPI0003B72B8C|nr:sulfotransferase [Marinococcus halotolerans]
MKQQKRLEELSPVIVIGMHRSGTTMLSKHLEKAGIFMGEKKEKNNESLFFLELNKWILRQCYARWDEVERYYELEKHPSLKKEIINKMSFDIKFYKKLRYLHKNLKFTNLGEFGWKDPQNTFTVDLWKEIFPKAKIIHIYRNPIDVAKSLQNREINNIKNFESSLKNRIKKNILNKDIDYINSFKVLNLDGGIDLWEKYMTKAKLVEKKYKGSVYSFSYEEYLRNPKMYLKNISQFLKVDFEDKELNFISQNLDQNRAFAFKKDEELVNYYKEIRNNKIVTDYNYSNIEL